MIVVCKITFVLNDNPDLCVSKCKRRRLIFEMDSIKIPKIYNQVLIMCLVHLMGIYICGKLL